MAARAAFSTGGSAPRPLRCFATARWCGLAVHGGFVATSWLRRGGVDAAEHREHDQACERAEGGEDRPVGPEGHAHPEQAGTHRQVIAAGETTQQVRIRALQHLSATPNKLPGSDSVSAKVCALRVVQMPCIECQPRAPALPRPLRAVKQCLMHDGACQPRTLWLAGASPDEDNRPAESDRPVEENVQPKGNTLRESARESNDSYPESVFFR